MQCDLVLVEVIGLARRCQHGSKHRQVIADERASNTVAAGPSHQGVAAEMGHS